MTSRRSMLEQGLDRACHDRLSRALGPDFEVLGRLGRGGFADVYGVRDCRLERTLAVKVLRPEIAWGPLLVSRFEREARALASLNHLNIPPIHFVGDNEGLVYYVMPLLEGRSLGDQVAENGPVDPRQVVDVMIPVLEALHHAHLLGIVHRGITADNIILEVESGRPLLVDFGVVREAKPERVERDVRSDIHAIGATMHHLLTGLRDPNSEIASGPTIPQWLWDIVGRALSSNPDGGYSSATAMAEALRVGRRSGGVDTTSVRDTIDWIREGDPTPTMTRPPSLESTTPPWHRREDRSPRERRRSRNRQVLPSWALFLGLTGAVAAYFLMVPLTFRLQNNLLVPVELSTGNGAVRTMAPGSFLSLPLGMDGRLNVRWFAVQPTGGTAGETVGESVSGVIRLENLNAAALMLRRVRRSIDTWSDGNLIFAPRVRNLGSQPIRVVVGRTGGIAQCNCRVQPGEDRLLGYYRLEPSSFVRLESPGSRPEVFTNLESRIDLNTGLLELKAEEAIGDR